VKLISLLLSAVVTFVSMWSLYKYINRNKIDGQSISVADMHPQKIINSYKETLEKVQAQRLGAMDEATDKIEGKEEKESSKAPPTLAKSESKVLAIPHLGGRQIERVNASIFQKLKGRWIYQGIHAETGTAQNITLTIQEEGKFSSARLRLQGGDIRSFGASYPPLWRDRKSNEILYVLTDDDYFLIQEISLKSFQASYFTKTSTEQNYQRVGKYLFER
jgi:hypothetical protein